MTKTCALQLTSTIHGLRLISLRSATSVQRSSTILLPASLKGDQRGLRPVGGAWRDIIILKVPVKTKDDRIGFFCSCKLPHNYWVESIDNLKD